MNDQRRKKIAYIIKLLQQVSGDLAEAREELSQAAEEEREYYDNMPEALQSSEKGERASSAADALEEAISTLMDFSVDDLIAQIEEAAE